MNRPQNHADSAYFVHQRYEDTALVIFQQQIKKKKKEVKNPGGQQTLPYQIQPSPSPSSQSQAQLSPGNKGRSASRSSESSGQARANSTSGSSSPHPPASPSANRTKLLSPSGNAQQSAHAAHSSEEGLVVSGGAAAAAAAAAASGPVGAEALLAAKLETEAAAPTVRQSDIILSHPLSNVEPEVTCGSAVDSPLQSSTHSDVTNPASENTPSVYSTADSFHSDTESDTAVRPDDPETDDETTRVSHVSECEVKAELTDCVEDKVKASSPDEEGEYSLPQENIEQGSVEDGVKHPLPVPDINLYDASEEEVKEDGTGPADSDLTKVEYSLIEDGTGVDSGNTEVKRTSGDAKVTKDLPDTGDAKVTKDLPVTGDSKVTKDLPDIFTEDEYKRRDSCKSETRSAAVESRVSASGSGVEFAHYGSAGVVARRKVAMSKSDKSRTQSRVCVVM